MSITRRQILAGATATAAVAAMPAVAIGVVGERGVPVTLEFLEEAQTEATRRLTVAWSQAMKQSWEQSVGPVDEVFAELYPAEYRTLQEHDCSKAKPKMVALFEDGARERMPRAATRADVLFYDANAQESA